MEPEVLAERVEGRCTLQAVLGDMTSEQVNAIVNAANSHLAHGGGLAGAIVDRGGFVIQEESSLLAPVAVGDAAVTSAGALPCRWVIHAVGPIWGSGNEERLLRSAVRSSLDRASALGAASVALPAISTGIFGYPKEDGVRCIVDEATRWLRSHPAASVSTLRFTAFDTTTAELFAAELAQK
jgi:O-acetyl-ADP-ribose deacetylase (regulator of RNase III)